MSVKKIDAKNISRPLMSEAKPTDEPPISLAGRIRLCPLMNLSKDDSAYLVSGIRVYKYITN
jgi:hypothetical protein